MKCPDVEQLMLFVDGELTPSEAAEVRNHIASCKSCQHEVREFQADLETEALLRKKVNNSFAKHQISNKIMTAIKAEPKHTKKTAGSSVLTNWLVRLLVPALAIAVVLLMFFSGTTTNEAPAVYQGRVYKVSVFTNNSESFIDNKTAEANQAFTLEPLSIKKLEGNFLVNVVSDSKNYSLILDGKTDIKFDSETMNLVFDNCDADISLVNGTNTPLIINGKKINIVKEKPIQMKKASVKKTADEKAKPVEISVDVKTVKTENKVKTVVAQQKVETINNSDTDISEEESLTTSSTSDITNIEILGEGGEIDEGRSPFEDQQVNGL